MTFLLLGYLISIIFIIGVWKGFRSCISFASDSRSEYVRVDASDANPYFGNLKGKLCSSACLAYSCKFYSYSTCIQAASEIRVHAQILVPTSQHSSCLSPLIKLTLRPIMCACIPPANGHLHQASSSPSWLASLRF